MHAAGLAHQDFYLVHFFVKPTEDDALYLIDLQRVIIQKPLPTRWIIKDLAQMLFSLHHTGGKQTPDLFQTAYQSAHAISSGLWARARKKAERIRNRQNRKQGNL
jgi:hypothetical protein